MREVEQTLREGASGTPRADANGVDVEGHLQKLKDIISVLRALGSPRGRDSAASGSASGVVSVHPRTTSTYENGGSSPFVGRV